MTTPQTDAQEERYECAECRNVKYRRKGSKRKVCLACVNRLHPKPAAAQGKINPMFTLLGRKLTMLRESNDYKVFDIDGKVWTVAEGDVVGVDAQAELRPALQGETHFAVKMYQKEKAATQPTDLNGFELQDDGTVTSGLSDTPGEHLPQSASDAIDRAVAKTVAHIQQPECQYCYDCREEPCRVGTTDWCSQCQLIADAVEHERQELLDSLKPPTITDVFPTRPYDGTNTYKDMLAVVQYYEKMIAAHRPAQLKATESEKEDV